MKSEYRTINRSQQLFDNHFLSIQMINFHFCACIAISNDANASRHMNRYSDIHVNQFL